MRIKRISLILLLIATFTGCVRYIDGRRALNKPYEMDPSIQYVGIDSFYQYEQEQRARLGGLVTRRIEAENSITDSSYRVGPGDKLQIQVKKFDDVSKEYLVSPAGTISIPFVGVVDVDKKSEAEISSAIAKKLGGFLVDPQVGVTVTEYSANVVWVLGEDGGNTSATQSTISGAYPLRRRNYSLVDLLIELGDPRIFSAGVIYLLPANDSPNSSGTGLDLGPKSGEEKGFVQNRFADNRLARWSGENRSPEDEEQLCDGKEHDEANGVRRIKACYPYQSNVKDSELANKYDTRARIEIDTEELFGGITKQPLRVPLVPGDAIIFPPSPIVQVFGEVQRRGTYQVANGRNGNGDRGNAIKPTLLSSIIASEGLTYSANIHEIEIYRELEYGNKVVMTVDLEEVVLRGAQDVRLRDGDIVWVPSQGDRFLVEHTVRVVNALANTALRVDDASNIGSN